MNPEPKPNAILRFVRWEAFLGIKIISAAGVLMILFGLFTFGRYVYLLSPSAVFAACGAVSLLSLLTPAVSVWKGWRAPLFFGLGAGVTAEFVMVANFFYYLRSNGPYGAALGASAGAAVGLSFAAFLIIPAIYTMARKNPFRVLDGVLLSSNLFFRFITGMFWIWIITKRYRAPGFIAAFFAVCCVVMAAVIGRYGEAPGRRPLRLLFFISGVTFAGIAVLFILEAVWLPVGLLIHAAGLSFYGVSRNRPIFIKTGAIVGACCLGLFLTVSLPMAQNPLFIWQYFAITAAAVIAAFMTLRIKAKWPSAELNTFRAAAALNVWGFWVFALYGEIFPSLRRVFSHHDALFASMAAIAPAFALAFVLPRLKKAANAGFQAAALILGGSGTLWLLVFNFYAKDIRDGWSVLGLSLFPIYLALNLVCAAWLGEPLRALRRRRRWYPLLLSGLTAGFLAQNLTVQLSLKPQSLILTLLLGLTALGWILYGFIRRNGILRAGGLGMSFIAVLKLFFIDLHNADPVFRMICYFTAGFILLAIAFLYHILAKRQSPPPGLDGGEGPMIQ